MTAPFSSSAAANAAPSGTAHPSVVTKLPNGLTVLVKEDDRFPLVSLRLYVHAGSAYETPEESGISHVLEHMVFKGTEKRPKGRVATDVEATGGYLNAATSFDYTVYLTDMTKEYWKTGLDVLKDMAFHPTLDTAELESEKDVIVAELKRGEDNPGQKLFRMAAEASLRGTPYERPIIGYEKTIRSFTSEGIRDYISRLYQPQSMLLVVCGNVKADEVLSEAQKQFGSLENTGNVVPPVNLENAVSTGGFTANLEYGPWNKAHLTLALPAPAMGDLRSAQLDVLTQILGGDASSRFYRTYKYEKRLVDSISVSNYSFERLGLIFIRATLDADKIVPFWESITRDLAALRNTTFSKEELDRAKLNIEDDMYRSKETLSGLASKTGYFAFFDRGEQGEENYLKAVRATDQAALLDVIKSSLSPDAASLVGLLPENAKAETLLPKEKLPAPPAEKTGKAAKTETWNAWNAWAAASLAENWPSAGPSEKDAAVADSGSQETIDLGKGRTMVLIPDTTLPYTAANLVFTGGDTLLDSSEQGLAAFTASLLTKGAGNLTANAVEDFLSDRAAAFGASSGRQTFSINLNTPSRFNADMFGLLKTTIESPAMKEEEADRVKESQIAAITAREDQPTGLAFRRLFPFLFGDHPYGYLQQGEKERVAKFTAGDASDFWKKQRKQPWVLSVCGTFDKEAVVAAAKALPAPENDPAVPTVPAWKNTKELDLTLAGRQQAHLFLVFPTVGAGSPDEAGLDLMQNILAGQSGLLFRDLRDEQGLGYTVTAMPWKADKTGALIFYIGTEPEKMQQAEQGFRKVIASLQTDLLPEEELVRGKNQMEGDYYRDHQSLASRSAEAAILTVMHRPLDASRKLVEDASKVTPEQIRDLAVKYFVTDKAYTLKVLP